MARASIPPKPPSKRVQRSGNPDGVRRSVSPQQLHDRRLRAVELRVAGWTFDEIAVELGISHQVARTDVHSILAAVEQEKVPELRALEASRLDIATWNALNIIMQNPGTELSLKATDKLLAAINTRARLFGLNAPVELQVTEQSEVDAEIARLLAQLETVNEQVRGRIVDGAVIDGTSETDITP